MSAVTRLPEPEAASPSELVLGVELSHGGRRWVWHPSTATASEAQALGLAQRLELPEILGRLLAMRGVTQELAAQFLAETGLRVPRVRIDCVAVLRHPSGPAGVEYRRGIC